MQGTGYEPWARVLGAGFGGLTQTTLGKAAQPLYAGGQQDIAAKMLRDAASDPDAALAKARAAQAATPVGRATGENIPGSKPTLSQVTRDPGLVGAETEYQTSNAVQHSQRLNAQSEAQSNALAGVQQGGDSTNVSDLITNHLNQIDQQHEAKLQAALKTHATEQQAHAQGVRQMETAARTQAGEVARRSEPETLGAKARKAIADSMATAHAKEKALWKAVDPDKKIAVPSNNIRAQARNIMRNIGKQKPPEGEEARILNKSANLPKKWAKFSDVADLTSDLKSAMRQERITHGSSPALRRMTTLLKTKENPLKNAATRQSSQEAEEELGRLRAMTPQDRKNLLDARAATRARGDIERGPMGPVLRRALRQAPIVRSTRRCLGRSSPRATPATRRRRPTPRRPAGRGSIHSKTSPRIRWRGMR